MTLHGEPQITRVRIFLSSLIMAMGESFMDVIMDCTIAFDSSRITDPDKLYSFYSFSCENVVIWRGHFNASGTEKSVNLSINGGQGVLSSLIVLDEE